MVEESQQDEDVPVTPTDTTDRTLKRRDTNQTIIAPSAFALANCSMGIKRYSKKRPSSDSQKVQSYSDDEED